MKIPIYWIFKIATHSSVEHRYKDLSVKWKKAQSNRIVQHSLPTELQYTREGRKRSGTTANCTITYEEKTLYKELYSISDRRNKKTK